MSRQPLQNRVDPSGQLHAQSHRGTLMGNRGILHDDTRQIRRQWAHKAWVTCTLAYADIRRSVFSPNNYSELFFLDEVTAFAAGHRPCNTCQRARHAAFRQAWLDANMAERSDGHVAISVIDAQLHRERAIRGGGKSTFNARLGQLPRGTMFEYEGAVCLVWTDGLLRWSFSGYSLHPALPPDRNVRVLTPASIVRMFASGFVPRVHPSADQCTGFSRTVP